MLEENRYHICRRKSHILAKEIRQRANALVPFFFSRAKRANYFCGEAREKIFIVAPGWDIPWENNSISQSFALALSSAHFILFLFSFSCLFLFCTHPSSIMFTAFFLFACFRGKNPLALQSHLVKLHALSRSQNFTVSFLIDFLRSGAYQWSISLYIENIFLNFGTLF